MILRKIWQCNYCKDIVVSDSNLQHDMNYCDCGKSAMDLSGDLQREVGDVITLSTKKIVAGKWVNLDTEPVSEKGKWVVMLDLDCIEENSIVSFSRQIREKRLYVGDDDETYVRKDEARIYDSYEDAEFAIMDTSEKVVKLN